MSESEHDQPPGPSKGTLLAFGVGGIVIVSLVLIVCTGMVGLGFMMPAMQRTREAQRAEAAARLAAEEAVKQRTEAEAEKREAERQLESVRTESGAAGQKKDRTAEARPESLPPE
ncbi:MAG: hypothetical protein HY290_26230 [Planctomycetia bacterium]|nr:hypothetical protein [Planctomycetia bacterium]